MNSTDADSCAGPAARAVECPATRRSERVEIGRVVKPHGVRGLVKVHLHDAGSETLRYATSAILVELPGRPPLPVVAQHGHGGGGKVVLQVEGVSDRGAAEVLRGGRLTVERAAISLEPGQYLYVDLLGCLVVQGSRSLGRVTDVLETGAADVLVVRAQRAADSDGSSDAAELLIPLVDDWVADVDLDARLIQVIDAAERWEDDVDAPDSTA